MKKELIVCILVVLLLLSPVLIHAETEQEQVDKAYSWLVNNTVNKWDGLNTRQNAFSLLALGCNTTYKIQGNDSLWERSYSSGGRICWAENTSSPNCELVETSLAIMALDEIDENYTDAKNWLVERNKTQTDLYWYLQLDVERDYNATCEVYYLGRNDSVQINEDKTVALISGSECLNVYQPNQDYYFEFTRNERCLGATYEIKCFSSSPYFTATMLYKNTSAGRQWYVSSETGVGIPGTRGERGEESDVIELQVPSYCLTELGSNSCSYEGTAWGAYVLSRIGDTDSANMFIPYLVINAERNPELFPSAFLAALIDGRFTDEAANLQRNDGFWIIQNAGGGVLYGRLYTTALAKLMLGSSADFTKAKEWVLSKQKDPGYFSDADVVGGEDRLRDNAFVLWTFWPDQCPGYGGGIGNESQCERRGGICRLSCDSRDEERTWDCDSGLTCCVPPGGGLENCTMAGGACRIDECESGEFFWETGFCVEEDRICCRDYFDFRCEQLEGEFCNSTQTCSGERVETVDSYVGGSGLCCLGDCLGDDPSNKYCYEIGEECDPGETCINDARIEIGFTQTLDGDCCTGKCVKDDYCSSIGEECSSGECRGSIIKTIDTDECCDGSCLQTCDDLGGELCLTGQGCTGRFRTASNGRCCIDGTCTTSPGEEGGFSLIWIIIIIIIVIVALYFFVFKKKPTKKEEGEDLFSFTKPKRPPTQPPALKLPQQRPFPQTRPLPRMPMMPRPTLKPATLPKPKTTTTRKTTTRRKRTTSKTDLEKTLAKLKKLTKK
ncbi:MAG: hypothetical protein JSW08_00945 [archaeon]|nr:MAG: hypothetical protein JSW08_00945 [archaeon]